jgi:hypothetical protein
MGKHHSIEKYGGLSLHNFLNLKFGVNDLQIAAVVKAIEQVP